MTDYGYETATGTVQITANQTSTHDVALTPVPRVTVSGTVKDGSGHGWPLYAKVALSDGAGHGQTTFTDPATGRYSLRVMENTAYTLDVASQYPGYSHTPGWVFNDPGGRDNGTGGTGDFATVDSDQAGAHHVTGHLPGLPRA